MVTTGTALSPGTTAGQRIGLNVIGLSEYEHQPTRVSHG